MKGESNLASCHHSKDPQFILRRFRFLHCLDFFTPVMTHSRVTSPAGKALPPPQILLDLTRQSDTVSYRCRSEMCMPQTRTHSPWGDSRVTCNPFQHWRGSQVPASDSTQTRISEELRLMLSSVSVDWAATDRP